MDYRDPEFRKKLVAFHGDACPISLFGARMGLVAMKHFGIEEKSPRNFIVITENPACLIDGIQFTTGCTVGSGNIIPENYGKLGATFYRKAEDMAIRIKIAPELAEEFEEIGRGIIDDMLKGAKFGQDERRKDLSKRFMQLTDEELFEVQDVEVKDEIGDPTPEQFLMRRGFIVHRTHCDSCGENVEETLTLKKDGRTLCMPCAGEGLYSVK